jgi:tripartite-type tricarboxylate transporter receptor subunit TctC
VRERFTEQGAEPVAMTPEELARFMETEGIKLGKVITTAGIPKIQ